MSTDPSSLVALAPVNYQAWSEVDVLGIVVKIDGTPFAVQSATWTENAHGAADTLTVTIPLSTAPDFPTQLFRGSPTFVQSDVSLSDLSSASNEIIAQSPGQSPNADVTIELWVGFPQSPTVSPTSVTQLTRFFLGEVDTYSGQFDTDTVTFSARSSAAHFVDDKLTGISLNQTIEQFLAAEATALGLPAPVVNISGIFPGSTVSVQPATIQEILAYDQVGGSNYQASVYGMTPADILTRGAQVDDTDWWIDVRTGTPHYESPDLVNRGTPINLQYGRDWKDESGQHSPQFSKNVQVVAYGYNPRTHTTVSVSVIDDGAGNVTTSVSSGVGTSAAILGTPTTVSTSTHYNQTTGTSSSSSSTSTSTGMGNFSTTAAQGASGNSAVQRYPLRLGNVTDPSRAVSMAQAYRRQITQHQYQIDGTVPVTKALLSQLSITSLLNISGNPWALTNGIYYPRLIEYTASVTEGFTAKVSALNHGPASGGV